jgi:hypothetical protein
MTIQVDPAILSQAANSVAAFRGGVTWARKSAATASVDADDHTGAPDSDQAQLEVGLQLAEATMRLENTLLQLSVNLALCGVAFDKGDYLASLPMAPPPSRGGGPVA